VVLQARRGRDTLVLQGVAHDDGQIAEVRVNGKPAQLTASAAGVVDWRIELNVADTQQIQALAVDQAGNTERTPHRFAVPAR
jgi:DNA gyrase inhibitor GyrI